jgi:outer membrane protein assembly factor BamE (lipoprotein component of BamABCDE complex)
MRAGILRGAHVFKDIHKRVLLMVTMTTLLGALLGCDPQRIEKLEEGVATEADVRKQFGSPAAVATNPDGSKVLEYPRQPEGWTNYLITIGADGKMSALKQQLTEANFAKVVPGMNKLEVMALLGKVAKSTFYELKGEEVWDWRFKDAGQQSRMFSVSFDKQGQVLRTGVIDDPKEMAGGK